MDNAQKAIMIGVGLFITIIVIAAVMLITGMGQDMLTSGQQQVSNISSSLQAQLTADFDGRTISGAQVIAAVKRYYTDDNMIILVNASQPSKTIIVAKLGVKLVHNYGKCAYNGISGENEKGYETSGTLQSTDTTKIGKLTDKSSSETYVPLSAKYSANVIRIRGTDKVVGLVFCRI